MKHLISFSESLAMDKIDYDTGIVDTLCQIYNQRLK